MITVRFGIKSATRFRTTRSFAAEYEEGRGKNVSVVYGMVHFFRQLGHDQINAVGSDMKHTVPTV